ncbi:MAG: IPT/TIG domain-containing protein [Steroidobacteraceae bacterium]
MRLLKLGPRLLLLVLVLSGSSCPPRNASPTISALSPNSGTGGTIVRIEGNDFGSDHRVLFDGYEVASQGAGSPVVFTVPYYATAGGHTVVLETANSSTPAQTFTVTTRLQPPDPVAPFIEGVEVGYFHLGASAAGNVFEIVLHGTGFDTNDKVIICGRQIPGYLPGVPTSALIGAISAAATLPGYPVAEYGRSLVAFVDKNQFPGIDRGSPCTAQVERGGTAQTVSNIVSFTIPARHVLVEIDRLDDTSVGWQPNVLFRDGRIDTPRRTYTPAGLLLDLREDDTVADPRAGTTRAGSAFSDAEMVDFFTTAQDMEAQILGGEWFFHVALLTTRDEPASACCTLGIMFRTADRRGMAVFTGTVSGQVQYLRTWLHEMGHGFNLSHCEGEAVINRNSAGMPITCSYSTLGTTLMNQTCALDTAFTYQFAANAVTHLTTHPENEVRPGVGQMAFNSASRLEGACDH